MQLILHKMLKTYTILASPITKRMHINSFYSFLFRYRSIFPEETAEIHIKIASYDQNRALNLEKSQHSVAFIHKRLIARPNPPHNLTQRRLIPAFISPMSAHSFHLHRPRRLRRVHFPQLFGICSPFFHKSRVFSEIFPPFSQLPPHDNDFISSSPPKKPTSRAHRSVHDSQQNANNADRRSRTKSSTAAAKQKHRARLNPRRRRGRVAPRGCA